MQSNTVSISVNQAKEILAFELTKLVHGEEEARKAEAGAKALFGGSGNITEEMYKEVLSFAAYVRQREEAKQTKRPTEEG